MFPEVITKCFDRVDNHPTLKIYIYIFIYIYRDYDCIGNEFLFFLPYIAKQSFPSKISLYRESTYACTPLVSHHKRTSLWPLWIASINRLELTSFPWPSSITIEILHMCIIIDRVFQQTVKMELFLPIRCSVLVRTRFKMLCSSCCRVGFTTSSPSMSPIRTAPTVYKRFLNTVLWFVILIQHYDQEITAHFKFWQIFIAMAHWHLKSNNWKLPTGPFHGISEMHRDAEAKNRHNVI